MKNKLWLLIACLAGLVSVAPLSAQESASQVGLGVYIGTPFGFSGKYLIDRNLAADMAFGAQGSNLDFHADLLTHFRDIPNQPRGCRIAPYVGLGIKVEDQSDTLFGFRFLGGVSFIPEKTPIEIFAEIAPILRLAPSTGSNFDGGVGLRYYFGGSSYSSGDSRHRVRR